MKNKVIIYDDNCPMCCAYTKLFVKTGLLEKDGRIPFSEIEESGYACQLDLHRSRHEIPLVDVNEETTLYGLESMLAILEQKIPFLIKVARFRPFYFCLQQLYKIISYNRTIIAGQIPKADGFDCTPDFNWFYRFVYLIIAFGSSSFIFHHLPLDFPVEILPLIVAFFVTSVFAFRKNLWNWLGHLATASLAGALYFCFCLLIPNSMLLIIMLGGFALIFHQLIHRIRLMAY